MKKIVVFLFLFLFLFVLPFFYLINYSQSIVIPDKKVTYELPYPGILPDHPLYFIKITRDRILEFATRDKVKKAELYLLLSDKRVTMAQDLAKKGKNKMAVSTLSKAEKYFLKIPPLLKDSKQQGVSPAKEFVEKLKLSNAKHREIIGQLLKELPQGDQEGLSEVLRINEEVRNVLRSL